MDFQQRSLRFLALCAISFLVLPAVAFGQHYIQTNLVSSIPGVGTNATNALDTQLINAWGLARSATSPWWISDNGTGLSTLYNGAGLPAVPFRSDDPKTELFTLLKKRLGPALDTRLALDTYPDAHIEGRVHSIMAGSGARFSLLPPENATGNYVKVVQRVPVRISIDRQSDPEHLLRVGMSVVPTILTGRTVKEIIAKSSNIGMAKIGQRLGPTRLYEGLTLFGFGRQVSVGLPGEAEGQRAASSSSQSRNACTLANSPHSGR